MKSYDPQKVARVWQRVQENQEPRQEENWPGLVQEALAAMGAYQTLARQLPKQAPLFQRLSREARAAAVCLRGICRMTQGSVPPMTPLPAPGDRQEVLLRKCYARSLRQVQEYDRRSGGEYGPALRRLADQEREHCQRLLEVMGEV